MGKINYSNYKDGGKKKKKLPTAEQFIASQKKEKTQIVPYRKNTKEEGSGSIQNMSKFSKKIYGIFGC